MIISILTTSRQSLDSSLKANLQSLFFCLHVNKQSIWTWYSSKIAVKWNKVCLSDKTNPYQILIIITCNLKPRMFWKEEYFLKAFRLKFMVYWKSRCHSGDISANWFLVSTVSICFPCIANIVKLSEQEKDICTTNLWANENT